MELAEALRCTYPVTDKTINMLLDVAELVPVKKKEAIVEQGKRTYHIFFEMRPELFSRIPMKYLAQYLKMQPETISRIRAKITKP